VAFIRSKKVHGYHYYQAVRNYRDREGKHRQEVLCHLGVHSSLEATIAAEQEEVKIHRKRAFLQRAQAKVLKDEILDLHGWEFIGGEIPSEVEAAREFDSLLAELEDYFSPYHAYSGTEFMEIEDIYIELDKYRACLDYHATMRLAGRADGRASDHQSKLDKLLRIQREYF
jgi:hypothetical protein